MGGGRGKGKGVCDQTTFAAASGILHQTDKETRKWRGHDVSRHMTSEVWKRDVSGGRAGGRAAPGR